MYTRWLIVCDGLFCDMHLTYHRITGVVTYDIRLNGMCTIVRGRLSEASIPNLQMPEFGSVKISPVPTSAVEMSNVA